MSYISIMTLEPCAGSCGDIVGVVDGGVFSRCIILSTTDVTYDVFCIDHGCHRKVPKESILKLPTFLSAFPMTALPCVISGIVCVISGTILYV